MKTPAQTSSDTFVSNRNASSRLSFAKKLGAYAAIGAGCSTFAATAADADIIYTDLSSNPLIFTTANTQTQFIDLDNDGVGDFKLGFSTRGPNIFNSFTELVNLSAMPGGPATNAFIGADFFYHGVSVSRFLYGWQFTHLNFWYTRGLLASHYTNFTPSQSGGQFQFRSTNFAAVRFEDGTGNTRFGWIELVSGANLIDGIDPLDNFQVTRYAYAIDMPIFAGQTANIIPEPSAMTSIGLLALGAAGLGYRRRKNKNSDQNPSLN